MKFDFTTILDRVGKDALALDEIPIEGAKVREGFSRLPMWVADMSFATAPSVVEAVSRRLAHPAFGYFLTSDDYYDSIIAWQKRRHGVTGLEREHIGYENGVLGGLCTALQAFTAPGESVLLHSPTYVGFTHSIEANGRKIIHSPLKRDENGIWRMDFEDMDRKLRENHIHFAVFCSPHNPCGRVWERWEIERAMDVYRQNECVVVSDEIWSDLILAGYKHIPTQSISEDARNRVIAMYAPSKTFNLAGLIGSYHIIYNPYLCDRMVNTASLCHYNSMNVLSMHALIGAYTAEGEQWVDELCAVLTENVHYACDYINHSFDGVTVSRPQGTYMLYLDCSSWLQRTGTDMDTLLRKGVEVGVIWQDGRTFKHPDTIRLNVALPLSQVKEAMERLDRYVFNASERA